MDSKDLKKRVDKIRTGQSPIGVVGLGYIGFSTAVYFAREGVRVVGCDIDVEKVKAFSRGEGYIQNIQYWVGFDFNHLALSGLVQGTTNFAKLHEAEVIFVCVPTESNGDPYMDILQDVVEKLATTAKIGSLVIVESTLTPGTAEKFVVQKFESEGRGDLLIAVAPRRDWFVQSEFNMHRLPRIVGGSTEEATAFAKSVLEIVCQTVIPATSHQEAELIKSVENAYRHMDIVLANQLCFAYPDVNMREVLNLIGTKWNINSYHPHLGVGGYCIAPASKYVRGGTKNEIPLLQEASAFTDSMPKRYADLMSGYRSPLVLGVSYKGALKVHILSPGLGLARQLLFRNPGLNLVLSDPMYSDDEIKKLVPKAEPGAFPVCCKGRDLIVVATDHPEYIVPCEQLLENLDPGTVILDVHSMWERYQLQDLVSACYIRIGEPDWQRKLVESVPKR